MKKETCLILLSFSSLLSSCGGGNSKIPNDFGVSAILSPERDLVDSERKIATRICYAYQSKSANFRSGGLLNQIFNFSNTNTDCQGSLINYSVVATLRYDDQNNLIFIPPSQLDPSFRFNGKVQTDSSGYLSQLCSKIKSNQPISNTTSTNTIKVQISFNNENNLDSYSLMYFNKQDDGRYLNDSAESYSVRTQLDSSSGQILGMDEIYRSRKICSSLDKESSSLFTQKFISH